MQPRKLQCCIRSDSIKPSLRFFVILCVLCFQRQSFFFFYFFFYYTGLELKLLLIKNRRSNKNNMLVCNNIYFRYKRSTDYWIINQQMQKGNRLNYRKQRKNEYKKRQHQNGRTTTQITVNRISSRWRMGLGSYIQRIYSSFYFRRHCLFVWFVFQRDLYLL